MFFINTRNFFIVFMHFDLVFCCLFSLRWAKVCRHCGIGMSFPVTNHL